MAVKKKNQTQLLAEDTAENFIHVAVGILINADKKILVALRHQWQSQGDLWEFPGGKFEPGEKPFHALVREMQEELGITVTMAKPWLRYQYAYPDKLIELNIWRIYHYHGQPHGAENQEIHWVDAEQLNSLPFVEGNYHLVNAVKALLL